MNATEVEPNIISVGLAHWSSISLHTMSLWIGAPLESLNLQILRLF